MVVERADGGGPRMAASARFCEGTEATGLCTQRACHRARAAQTPFWCRMRWVAHACSLIRDATWLNCTRASSEAVCAHRRREVKRHLGPRRGDGCARRSTQIQWWNNAGCACVGPVPLARWPATARHFGDGVQLRRDLGLACLLEHDRAASGGTQRKRVVAAESACFRTQRGLT